LPRADGQPRSSGSPDAPARETPAGRTLRIDSLPVVRHRHKETRMKALRSAGDALRTVLPLALCFLAATALVAGAPAAAGASELDLKIPAIDTSYSLLGNQVSGLTLLYAGLFVCVLGMGFGMAMFNRVRSMPAHRSMLDVSNVIYETCKTYLLQQGRLLVILEIFIAVCIVYYFGVLQHLGAGTVALILMWSVIGILGSYSVAWFGIRMNTFANSRTAFASLRGKPLPVYEVPLTAGMSIGVLLICVELIMMLVILLFVPRESAGASFLGFAIGESLGASALRIGGGIFTKIADIGSDLMKVVFKIKEDDPRNPGVIADCTGDNAGDSVGPTADGFETYGVTGVALISFITLALTQKLAVNFEELQVKLIVWIFAMRFLMDFMSGCSYFVNERISKAKYSGLKTFNFEEPLTRLIWIAAILCISTSYWMSWLLIGDLNVIRAGSTVATPLPSLWWQLATIISCGTLAAVLIPEFTKVFTSSHSKHVHEIVTASREGGASLTILSGLVAGNFSAFWKGMLIAGLMGGAYFVSQYALAQVLGVYAATFAFGLVAFGFLCMGPVNIAVDSYGPVTDNAQSVFELAQTEHVPGIKEEIKKDFGFEPDFEGGKHHLEANDSAGNTFKATAKPVLIGTAVVGATTMIFSIILLLEKAGLLKLSLTDAPVLLGFICGGAVIYWFCGASMQAVTTGAYRAVEFIKKNLNLEKKEADIEDSKTVVKICTQYAQSGMWNIFVALMALTLAFAFFDPNFFVAYLVSIAVFGLYQAIFMANAGGSWDNAKKLVEVDFKEKNTPVHAATVVGDTVGDPFKDTTSVALNPIIKFSTLFGLLAVEIALKIKESAHKAQAMDFGPWVGVGMLAIGLVFVWRSFYSMRIPKRA
jgi:K(+)-stimulated pyrophosphate-energized sodium pump